MNLVIDTVYATSTGITQIRDAVLPEIANLAPENSKITLLVSNKTTITHPKIQIKTIEKPKGKWIGPWQWYNQILPQILQNEQATVLYSFPGIVTKKLKKIVGLSITINNMMPFSEDMLALYPKVSTASLRYKLLYMLYKNSINLADTVVLHSQYGLDLISHHIGDISKKTHVVLTGIPTDIENCQVDRLNHPYQGKPYFFYLSVIRHYKNHIRLVEAYKQLLDKNNNLPDLILAGLPEDIKAEENLYAFISKHNLENKIHYIGIIERETISGWLHHASVNLLPTMCETNCVVVAEILGVGGALVCSDIPPLKEVAGSAALYFNPESPKDIAEKLKDAYYNQDTLIRIRANTAVEAKKLSWQVCSAKIWQAIIDAERAFVGRENGKKR